MAYTHGKHEYIIGTTGAGLAKFRLNVNTTNSGEWMPGYMPFLVRAVSAQRTTTSGTECVISFRDVPGYSTAQATGHQFTNVTLASGLATNLVYYRDDFTPRVISPGHAVRVRPTTASTGDSVICRIYGEYTWETPVNATGRLVTG